MRGPEVGNSAISPAPCDTLKTAPGAAGLVVGDFQTRAEFIRITAAGFRESHVHDVTITRESPNYPREG